ncbi:hypothetical protein AAE478_002725 [Parahypoxylon ruwenzoriense]
MSKAPQTAKEKYQAVIDDAGRGDFVCRTNRIGATRYPSSGECHVINKVDHPQQRRRSSGTIREKIRDLINLPAS